MKFVHIGDLHLGAEPDSGKAYSKNRDQEFYETLERVVAYCNEQKAELLLFSGDIFHHQPLLRELKELDYLFSKLHDTRVVMIAGNHDYIKPRSFYLTYQWESLVYFLSDKELDFVEFPELKLAVYGFSYHTPIIEAALPQIAPSADTTNHILLLHGGDAKHLPFDKKELAASGFDYVALGHIHKPEILVPGKMAYAGSLEPLDKTETGDHGFIVGELVDSQLSLTFVPFAKRKYIELRVSTDRELSGHALRDKVQDEIWQHGRENMYKVILVGFRSAETLYDTENFDTLGNIVEIIDDTEPYYNLEKLYKKNENNLLGKFIASFKEAEEGSLEYEALIQGVEALMRTRRDER